MGEAERLGSICSPYFWLIIPAVKRLTGVNYALQGFNGEFTLFVGSSVWTSCRNSSLAAYATP